jgi:hypothetical protein
MAQAKSSGSNDARKNGKAWKKNPGSDGVKVKHNVTRAGRIEGRSAANHAKREAWKAAGGRVDHPSIPHWKTGEIYKKEKVSVSNDA